VFSPPYRQRHRCRWLITILERRFQANSGEDRRGNRACRVTTPHQFGPPRRGACCASIASLIRAQMCHPSKSPRSSIRPARRVPPRIRHRRRAGSSAGSRPARHRFQGSLSASALTYRCRRRHRRPCVLSLFSCGWVALGRSLGGAQPASMSSIRIAASARVRGIVPSTISQTMPLDLTEDEERALVQLLRRTLDFDPYPHAPRLDPLKAIMHACMLAGSVLKRWRQGHLRASGRFRRHRGRAVGRWPRPAAAPHVQSL
jgi:hypothetical protein